MAGDTWRRAVAALLRAGAARRTPLTAILAGLLTLMPLPVLSQGADMYRTAIAVQSQSADDTDRGMKSGLSRVIVKLSGRSDAAQNDVVRDALKAPRRYLRSFTYKQSSAGKLLLNMQFDSQLIQNLLRRAELPMWVSGRPTVLMWLLVHESSGKRIVSPGTTPQLVRLVETQMARRGIPIKWPSQPFGIDPEDVRLLDTERILDASAQYPEQAIFATSVFVKRSRSGMLAKDSGATWAGNCLYLSRNDQSNVHCRKGTNDIFLGSAVDSLADVLTDKFSVQIVGGESQLIRIEVSDIDSFENFGRALTHLESNALVRNTNVVNLLPGRVVFELDLQGTRQQFYDSLSRQRVLRLLGQGTQDGMLRYSLNTGQI